MKKDENEPILTLKRKKSLFNFIYHISFIFWIFATLIFIPSWFIMADTILKNIIGVFLIISIFYWYFGMFDIRLIQCYEKYFIIQRILFSKKIYYSYLKKYDFFRSFAGDYTILIYKKYRFGTHINEVLFDKDDFTKFIELLENKGIYEYNLLIKRNEKHIKKAIKK
ncbi:putative membrane protein [Campylobacter blaseri]|uniref:Uncharacterized protein n=1 Tax=Campylobacter blaseri TaxID=2042961 RepID=A0A2P8R3N2_9BACT|nr:hypothetical protein [Campylobacter blaseri]PSM53095.1 hypothetical protein CQ405_00655 [Campylobacter blaseri]PSM54562.1 hypothetical protein CRN67_00655 [Campylobacter blaseri]QKF86967.1 putative membrane protein [Campylobacter blaseri]